MFGSSGAILHYDVFILGRDGVFPSILHFNGHAVAAKKLPTPMWTNALWRTGAGTVFAVGNRGRFIRTTAN